MDIVASQVLLHQDIQENQDIQDLVGYQAIAVSQVSVGYQVIQDSQDLA